MAHHKRKRPKIYKYPGCPGGNKCKYCPMYDKTRNSQLRYWHRDWRQPQMYDNRGKPLVMNNV